MNTKQSLVALLVELDQILKLECKEDAMNVLYSTYPTNPEADVVREKYARCIFNARKILGLSLEVTQGALLVEECKEEDAFSSLLRKN